MAGVLQAVGDGPRPLVDILDFSSAISELLRVGSSPASRNLLIQGVSLITPSLTTSGISALDKGYLPCTFWPSYLSPHLEFGHESGCAKMPCACYAFCTLWFWGQAALRPILAGRGLSTLTLKNNSNRI